MLKVLIIGLGGFIGAVGRYGLSGLVHRFANGSFPYGTLVVNIAGCFAIGGMLYLVEDRGMLGPTVRFFVAIGLLGSFTTFSTFGYETLELLRDGEMWQSALNVAGNVVLGLAAVWLGRTTPALIGI